jgi:putative hemolysin
MVDGRTFALALLLTSIPAGVACGDDDDDGPARMPNPASVFCEQEGGHVEIERDAAGNERGICVLPDGRQVDEWQYYEQHHPEG